LTRKDFTSDQVVRWCPGCGDYSILAQAQTVFAELGIPRENFAILSGIGCSSRFPYYVNAYGFHTIHGRAPTFATGLKATRPELSVWVVTGDGDALSIGGNHILHVLRRNVNLQILLFNNRIYGLTKGQYSPTSEISKVTSSSPYGSLDYPVVPCAIALGAEATFVARTVDVMATEEREILRAAHEHQGSSFVEILQNCNIYNDGTWEGIVDRKVRDDRTIQVRHGQPLVFGGKEGPRKGLRAKGFAIEIIELGGEFSEADCLVHDETNSALALMLARLAPPFPVALGVLHRVRRPTYDQQVQEQLAAAKASSKRDLAKAIRSGNTWEVG
jgi:2-oxoglutarate ferredoxin oxidoreductase subunit beta